MAVATTRTDLSARQLRVEATAKAKAQDAKAARRMPAIALVAEGGCARTPPCDRGHAERARRFRALFLDAMGKHAVPRDQLTPHADRDARPLVICTQITGGQRTKAQATALMPAELSVLESPRRPHSS
jgi:hypothetical protein